MMIDKININIQHFKFQAAFVEIFASEPTFKVWIQQVPAILGV